jgi:hypothetical protein
MPKATRAGCSMISAESKAPATQFGHGAAEFPEELVWLWRHYDPAKTEQTHEMKAAEKSKPLLRVSITNRETQ